MPFFQYSFGDRILVTWRVDALTVLFFPRLWTGCRIDNVAWRLAVGLPCHQLPSGLVCPLFQTMKSGIEKHRGFARCAVERGWRSVSGCMSRRIHP